MVYSINAMEQQRLYILCHLKKPARSSIQAHMTWMETLNKYLEQLPTIKNNPQAIPSTEYGNVPFNESTLASIKTLKHYLINYPYLSDYGQTIFCLSFPSRDRATAPGR